MLLHEFDMFYVLVYHQEHTRLYESAFPVTDQTYQQPERTVPMFPRLVTGIIKNFF